MTEHIRWQDDQPYGGIRGSLIGYAVGLTAEAFRIYPPSSHTPRWTLSSYYPIALGERRYADDPDELKAEAETWLERFVSSLGAVFPEEVQP